MKPLFNELSEARLQKAIDLMRERGEQYSDTMRLSQWTITRAVAKTLGINVTVEQARAIAVAGLCDVKHDRFEGGYREDNVDDGINYLSILPGLVDLAKQRSGIDDGPLLPDPGSIIDWGDGQMPMWGEVDNTVKYVINTSRLTTGWYMLRLYGGSEIVELPTIELIKARAESMESK